MGIGELNMTHSRIAAIYYWLLSFHCLARAPTLWIMHSPGSEVRNNTAAQIFEVLLLACCMRRQSLTTYSDLSQAILSAFRTVNLL